MKGNDWATYKRLLKYVWPYWPLFIVSILGFLLGSGAEAFFLNQFKNLVDNWDTNLIQNAKYIPILMFAAVIVRGIGEILGELFISQISFNVVHNIRTALFDQLLNMPSAYFDASTQGHLVSRITYNVSQLRDTGTDALKSLLQDGIKVFVYLGAMLYLSWKLTLLFAAVAPFVGVVVAFASKRFRRISKRIQNSMGDVTHAVSETVSGYRVVRIFSGEAFERARFHKASNRNKRQNLKMVATKVSSTHIVQVFVVGVLCILIALLLKPEIGGDLSTGDLVIFLGFAGMLSTPIRKLTEINARLQRGLAAADDVFSQLDESEEVDEGTFEVDRVKGRIEFRKVDFSYAESSGPVLKNLDLVIEPGQTVALVGKSGGGKSTLARLIPRFYEASAGEILLDGEPISNYRLSSLRKQFALVNQQVSLFNDTLERNIAYGALADATETQIQQALLKAHADVFVNELPDGLQTFIGDDGVLLSGGQRQRIAIARALLKDAPILILDEATSALDAESERHIQAALEEAMRGRTTIVIAHRLSTIEKADVILVMSDGAIVESGTHSELIQANGAYTNLHNAQFNEDNKPRRSKRKKSEKAAVANGIPANSTSNSKRSLSQKVQNAWNEDSPWLTFLAPFSWIFGRTAEKRRSQFKDGSKTPWRAPVPVIVVGNIAAGGTGKTPLVIWLVNWLSKQGYQPGVVSRGYGGSNDKQPLLVHANTAPALAGDEAPLIAKRTNCPVMVCSDRVAAIKSLIDQSSVDILVTDDGLQHYQMARDIEIAVVDGDRGIGNGRLLPSGPLREAPARLQEVDWVVCNSSYCHLVDDEILMKPLPQAFVHLKTGKRQSVEEFVAVRKAADSSATTDVIAVAGIGNPKRFQRTLTDCGLQSHLISFKDHHDFTANDLLLAGTQPIVCTEKDATKLATVAKDPVVDDRLWYLEIDLSFEQDVDRLLTELLSKYGFWRKN